MASEEVTTRKVAGFDRCEAGSSRDIHNDALPSQICGVNEEPGRAQRRYINAERLLGMPKIADGQDETEQKDIHLG